MLSITSISVYIFLYSHLCYFSFSSPSPSIHVLFFINQTSALTGENLAEAFRAGIRVAAHKDEKEIK